MAVNQSVQQTYVYNQTSGAVTETVNGNWLQAYCEYLGVTQPVNSSWLQALCYHFGITQPLYASWTIALANYYGITAPQNGSWWYAISQDSGAPIPVIPFIWGLNTRKFGFEPRIWNYVTPVAPTADFTSDITIVAIGDQVQFTDTSAGIPTSWNWIFTGGTPATSNEQNPLIQYDTEGSFSVSLEAINALGSDTKTVPDYIIAIDELTWNTTDIDWDLTDVDWATAVAPVIEFQNQSFTDVAFPTLVGTATAGKKVFMSIDGNDYETIVDEFGAWSIVLLNQLPQAVAPGNDYTASAYAFDAATGLTSATVNATITMITTFVDVVAIVNLYDSYGDGWNGGWIELQRETSPGTWESTEYNENPFRFNTYAQYTNYINNGDMTGALYYKTDDGIYGLGFEAFEPGVTNNGAPPISAPQQWKTCENLRSVTCVQGNWRVIIGRKGLYPDEQSYQLVIGGVPSTLVPLNTSMETGDVIQTFTI